MERGVDTRRLYAGMLAYQRGRPVPMEAIIRAIRLEDDMDTHPHQTGFDFTKGPAPYTGAIEVMMVRENTNLFREGFDDWLVNNWHIWREFNRQACAMRARGFKRYSARTIIEWLRHHTSLAEVNGMGWKLNNDIVPDLSRLWTLMNPEALGFFETRLAPQGVRTK